MDDLQIEQLKRACVVIGGSLTRATETLREAIEGVAAAAAGVAKAFTLEDDKRNPVADLRRHLEEMYALYANGEFAEMAEVSVDIPPPKKIPRPPKRLGPINKANYSVNQPARRARSNCRTMKR